MPECTSPIRSLRNQYPVQLIRNILARMAARDAKLTVEDMTPRQAKREHARLEAEIKQHDEAYYQKDAPAVSDADYDALRRRYEAIEAKFPDLQTLESLSRKVGAAPGARLRQGAPRGADAVVAERVRCRGGAGLRRSHPPLPQLERGRAARVHGGAEDRRAVDVAALRGRRSGQGGDTRRWLRRRGRHRQCADHQGDSAQAEGQECRRCAKSVAKST